MKSLDLPPIRAGARRRLGHAKPLTKLLGDLHIS